MRTAAEPRFPTFLERRADDEQGWFERGLASGGRHGNSHPGPLFLAAGLRVDYLVFVHPIFPGRRPGSSPGLLLDQGRSGRPASFRVGGLPRTGPFLGGPPLRHDHFRHHHVYLRRRGPVGGRSAPSQGRIPHRPGGTLVQPVPGGCFFPADPPNRRRHAGPVFLPGPDQPHPGIVQSGPRLSHGRRTGPALSHLEPQKRFFLCHPEGLRHRPENRVFFLFFSGSFRCSAACRGACG